MNLQLKRTNSDDPDFRQLIGELDTELRVRNGELMNIYDQHNIIDKIDTVLIAHLDEVPAACGCFKFYDYETVEIKRMFVRPAARGKGISTQVLSELEKWAGEQGFSYTVLETGSRQVEALGLYPKAGYVLVPNYGQYKDLPDSVCFRKTLPVA